MYEITRNVLAEVKKAIVGKDGVISKVWIALLAEGHVLLEDVPGVGKTTMALAFSRALGLDTKRIQFTPDTMPSDIIGFSMPGKDGMVYQPGAIMTNLLLADEINRTSSKTQSALLAMTEIARLEHIRVTDEDVERRYQEMSRQFGVPVEHIRQQLPPMQLSHDLKLAYARAVVVDSGVRL